MNSAKPQDGSTNSNADQQQAAANIGPPAQNNNPAQQALGYQQFVPNEEIVQVVYQSNPNGSLVGVETSLLGEPSTGFDPGHHYEQSAAGPVIPPTASGSSVDLITPSAGSNTAVGQPQQQQLSRSASTLPPVAEESSQGPNSTPNGQELLASLTAVPGEQVVGRGAASSSEAPKDDATNFGEYFGDRNQQFYSGQDEQAAPYGPLSDQGSNPVYSTVNKQQPLLHQQTITENQVLEVDPAVPVYSNVYSQPLGEDQPVANPASQQQPKAHQDQLDPNQAVDGKENIENIDEDIGHILSRHKAGAVESGSFRHNFRKKLGMSISTNENDLTAYRQKLLESQEAPGGEGEQEPDQGSASASGGSKFKRTHSVSFNVGSSRSNRHSVDIRNLPSYLTHKRASIVDVAKGAMSSLISSFGGTSGPGSSISGSHRRDSSPDEEPIFEEPIAPTLSLGQRVALVRSGGSEFGTVGWIGQLPDVEDDWIVGVIFDNMIGNCDGAYKGTRYFYARENYAMFVPLSMLTKTDNYIGRPETGTMLSRMSVSLKPGQLISIQRSSIRLQHCFLNAPHQRVGHDVRAVSNRLHCQCHNCGPCAHLTKQGRMTAMPHFGAHHVAHTKKKNSLAHAAVEMLAHHHHHFHEEEEHDEEDYKFGDNAAHACNYVRYSCCQQNGVLGHEFLNDCEMVRPELLDNLIHAPKAPHRRSRPKGSRGQRGGKATRATMMVESLDCMNVPTALLPDGSKLPIDYIPQASNQSTLDTNNTLQSSYYGSETTTGRGEARNMDGAGSDGRSAGSSYSSSSSRSSSVSREDNNKPEPAPQPAYNYYQYESSTYSRPAGTGAYGTMDSQFSIMDQRRYIYQRDSSAIIGTSYQASETSEASSRPTGGFGAGIMRCFRCFKRRDHRSRRARGGGKRKLSAKDRMIEYRRKQSTFVPSTLAKPQEDFASHGIILPSSLISNMPIGNNSDFSSCSKSSNCSSRSHSPSFHQEGGMVAANQQQTVGGSIFNSIPDQGDQLKSSNHTRRANYDETHEPQLNYGDYTFGDGYDSHKLKNELSRDSALTDLCYSDTYKTGSSCDTLKHLVDQSINEQVSLPEPIFDGQRLDTIISPLSSSDDRCECQSPASEQIDVSSPTASATDYGAEDDNLATQVLDNLNLESERDHEE